MWQFPSPALLAIPAYAILIACEIVMSRYSRRVRYDVRDAAASVSMGVGSIVIDAIFGFLFVAFAAWVAQYRFWTVAWSWSAIALCIVCDDLTFYWWHRTAHRVRWFWAEHVNHHSSRQYNFTTALRQPWGGYFTPSYAFKAPMILMGFPLEMMAFVGGLTLAYQFWIHTEAIAKCPRWFEFAMNTPSHHRVHHATNARYLDRNFAAVFIVWDRMFGTFTPENAADPPQFGIVSNIDTFNPFRIAFHEWAALLRDLRHAASPRDFLGFLLGVPGWSPDGSRLTSDMLRSRWIGAGSPGRSSLGDFVQPPKSASVAERAPSERDKPAPSGGAEALLP
jgi:sterol desaturase/sphingolipid hydroxylase (fatty acid hydroxylase superfamily)